jgi:hypothetical protein
MKYFLKSMPFILLTTILWYCSKLDHEKGQQPNLVDFTNEQVVSRDSFATDSCGHYSCIGTITLLSATDTCWYLLINARKVCTKTTDPACLVARYRTNYFGCNGLPPYPHFPVGATYSFPIYDEGDCYFRAYGPPGLQLRFQVTTSYGTQTFIVKNANIYGPTIKSFDCDDSKTVCPGGGGL